MNWERGHKHLVRDIHILNLQNILSRKALFEIVSELFGRVLKNKPLES